MEGEAGLEYWDLRGRDWPQTPDWAADMDSDLSCYSGPSCSDVCIAAPGKFSVAKEVPF